MNKKDFLELTKSVVSKLDEYKVLLTDEDLKIIEKLATLLSEKVLNNVKNVPGHEIDHTIRVLALSIYIGRKLNANLKVIIPCTLFHDVARLLDPYVKNHSIKSAEIVEKMFNEGELDFPKGLIKEIVNCVKEHSYSAKLKPSSLESMIVQDADKLDALGLIGVARVFAFGGFLGRPIAGFIEIREGNTSLAHFYEKIMKLGDLLNTDIARKIAEKKLSKVREFVEEFERELNSFGLCDIE